ncbi:MAG: cytochrome c oxidase subunit 4 [Anaerolineales bacterium]|nr:cytochrome c oxidase subunit 4 [Anaerolineales bacterium]
MTAAPAPAETDVLEHTNGVSSQNGHEHGAGSGQGGDLGGNGGGDDDRPQQPPKRRRSYWPFLLDLGLVLALFGLIIAGRPLMVVGAVIFVVALVGWVREARADYSSLAD